MPKRPALRRAVQNIPVLEGPRGAERVIYLKITDNGHGFQTVGALDAQFRQIKGTREPFDKCPLAASRFLSEVLEHIGRS